MSASTTAVVLGAAALAAIALFPKPATGSRSPLHHAVGRRARGAAARRRTGARWARATDLEELVVAGRTPPPGRLALGRSGRRLIAAEAAQSVIVFGPTQSRKTSGFAVPAILEWRGPVLAASVKSDLLAHTVAQRRTLGRIQCFDPTGTTGLPPSPWSPLPGARTWPGARRAAATLTEVGRGSVGTMSDGDFWYATAARMLAPLLFAAAHGRKQMADVLHWVETGEEDEVLFLLRETGVPEALDAARSAFAKEERQRSSIATTVETLLEPFAGGPGCSGGTLGDPGGDPVDPDRLLSGTDTLYLCAPAHDQRRLTPLFVGVFARGARPCLRPGGPLRASARSAAPGRARRGGQHRPALRPRRARRNRGGPRGAAGDGVARPGPDQCPVRSEGLDCGQQPSCQALPLGHLRSVDARLREHPDGGRGAGPARHHLGGTGWPEHHPLALGAPARAAGRTAQGVARQRCARLPRPAPGPAGVAHLVRRPVAAGPSWPWRTSGRSRGRDQGPGPVAFGCEGQVQEELLLVVPTDDL